MQESGYRSRWRSKRELNRAMRRASRESKLALREELGRRWRSWKQQTAAEDKVLQKMSARKKEEFWKMSYDQRRALLSFEALERRTVRRRTLLGVGVLASAAAFFGIDTLRRIDRRSVQNQKQKLVRENVIYAKTHLEVLDICKDWFPPRNGQKHPTEVFFTTAGIGILNSVDAARPMGIDGLGLPDERTSPMTYLITSVEGKKIPEVADIILKASRLGEGLSLYGQSNGGIVLLEALNYLKTVKKIKVPVKRLVLNCSPFDFNDARDNALLKLLGRLLVFSGYEPGEIGQFFFQLKEDNINRTSLYDRTLKKVEDAWGASKRQSPTSPWVSDLRILIQSRLAGYDFSGIITKDTEVLLLKSKHDDVVYNQSAIRKYRVKFKSYGARVTEKTLPGGAGHADVQAGGIASRSWLDRTNRFRAE